MNVLVVDTSSWIEYFRGRSSRIIDVALQEGRVFLPPVVAAELLSGYKPEGRRSSFIKFLHELAACDCDIDHWIRVGELRAKLIQQGLTVSIPDCHIAQCALDLKGYLLSEDKIFSKFASTVGMSLQQEN